MCRILVFEADWEFVKVISKSCRQCVRLAVIG